MVDKAYASKKISSIVLIEDTTQVAAVSTSSKKFEVLRGQLAVIRSSGLDGTGVVALYYDAPNGTVNNPATFDSGSEAGSQVTLTPIYPERIINVPGVYRMAVTSASNSSGQVFVNV